MGAEVVLDVRARVLQRHVVLLEQCVHLKARVEPQHLADLRLRQCTGTVALDRDGFERAAGHVVPLLLEGGGYFVGQLNGDPHNVQLYAGTVQSGHQARKWAQLRFSQLSPRTFWTLSRELSSRRRDDALMLEELSGGPERSMIIAMPTTTRPQHRYNHRLRQLVQRTGDVTVATNLGVPRSTARGWRGAAPTVVASLDVADLTEPELRQEVLKRRRRVQKLAALLRLAQALLRTSGCRLNAERLPDGRAKMRLLRAVDRAHAYLPLRTVLRFLRVSPSRFHAWRRRPRACALDDQSSCPRTLPCRLTSSEVRVIHDMVTSPQYRHVPTGTLAVLAQRLGKVWASPSTWYRLVRKYGWRRPASRT